MHRVTCSHMLLQVLYFMQAVRCGTLHALVGRCLMSTRTAYLHNPRHCIVLGVQQPIRSLLRTLFRIGLGPVQQLDDC